MSKNQLRVNDYQPKRFGLKYDPPAIVLEYLTPSNGKLYHHKIKIDNLKPGVSMQFLLDQLKVKHHLYFLNNKVKDEQISSLLQKLLSRLYPQASGRDNFSSKSAGVQQQALNKKPDSQGVAKHPQAQKITSTTTPSDVYEQSANLELYDVDYADFNLNQLSNEELQVHKNKMMASFTQNQVKPGDPNYVYDKREQFTPVKNNEWDEDLENIEGDII